MHHSKFLNHRKKISPVAIKLVSQAANAYLSIHSDLSKFLFPVWRELLFGSNHSSSNLQVSAAGLNPI